MDTLDIVDIVPRVAAVVRKTVRMADMAHAQREAHAILSAALGATAPIGPRLTVWRPPKDGAIEYAPGLFVPDNFEASGDVTRFPLPAGRAAHFRHDGPYERLGEAWQQVFAACAARGAELGDLHGPGRGPEDGSLHCVGVSFSLRTTSSLHGGGTVGIHRRLSPFTKGRHRRLRATQLDDRLP